MNTRLRIVIQEEIYCDNHNLKKYLSPRYVSLVNKNYYKQIVTFVCFPIDQTAITSKNVEKALKKLKNKNGLIITIVKFMEEHNNFQLKRYCQTSEHALRLENPL